MANGIFRIASRTFEWLRRRRKNSLTVTAPVGGITRIYIKQSNVFIEKPLLHKAAGSFVEKQVKIKQDGTFVNV